MCSILYYKTTTINQKVLIVLRYTSDDNRSMQLNPENDRYWSSRGYQDDDDDGYEESSFDLEAFNKRREIENIDLKKRFDNLCLNFHGKKVFFRQVHDRSSPMYKNAKKFFKDVLKENDSVERYSSAEGYKGLTVDFKSFKDFFVDSIESAAVENIIDLGIKHDLLFLYFQDVYFSESYIVFWVDIYKQGYWQSSGLGMGSRWSFAHNSYESLRKVKPEVLYENFEDVYTCKKYLVDL